MDLKVFITNQNSTCDECGEKLRHHAWITLVENKGALCLSCADIGSSRLPSSGWRGAEPPLRQIFHPIGSRPIVEPRPQAL